MVKLFIADLDGCISHPFESPDWEAFSGVRDLNRRSFEEDGIPYLTLCSGRPLPYVEAVGQMLDVRLPFIFESGGGLYDMRTNKLTWSKHYNNEMREKIKHIKGWVGREVIDRYDGTIAEFAKETDVGLINPDADLIREMYQKIDDYVKTNFDEFETHHTNVSINVIMKKSNKGAAVEQLSRMIDIPLEQIAYIGDGTNDIPALERVGHPFAPINAREETKQHAEVVDLEATDAVLDVYRRMAHASLRSGVND